MCAARMTSVNVQKGMNELNEGVIHQFHATMEGGHGSISEIQAQTRCTTDATGGFVDLFNIKYRDALAWLFTPRFQEYKDVATA